ncbi:hypothetical protein SO802_014892 [Lithocarpus litseifolius]|uniref:Uncharacterized protein n=1 Tax=Lithocarpus litseifolius TaxID=425828 RepID=A0AAW2CVS2_9ROSI
MLAKPITLYKVHTTVFESERKQMSDAVRIDRIRMLKEQATNPDRRDKINRILTDLGKFAVDSAVNDSLKAVNGRKQVHQIVQEGFKHQPPSPSLNDEKKSEDLKLVMEELQAVMEETQEDVHKAKQGNKISAKSISTSENLEPQKKTPNEGNKELHLPKMDKKRVFIRSRL